MTKEQAQQAINATGATGAGASGAAIVDRGVHNVTTPDRLPKPENAA